MYDQVKKSWAKQSVALDVSTIFMSEFMLKSPDFMRGKRSSIFNYLFIGS